MTTKASKQEPITLPTSSKAALYIRTGTSQESRLTTDLHEVTQEILVRLATGKGWTIDNLIVFEDKGVSATTPLENRAAMQALLNAVREGEIKAILLYSEYSLWRDANSIEVNAFIELCKKHTVFVVTPEFVFDFTNPMHEQLFRFTVETSSFALYARMSAPERLHGIHQKSLQRQRKIQRSGRARIQQPDENTVITYQMNRLFPETPEQ